MSKKTHIWVEDTIESNGQITKSVTIEHPVNKREKLWYQLPIKYKSCVTQACDPFVVATLFLSMSGATDLHIHGEVSPSLLRNLEEFQAAWNCWRPKHYTKIEIIADLEREQNKEIYPDKAVLGFSGGVDSCFSAWRHRIGNPSRQRYNLRAGIMVHGFDIPLDQPAVFELAAKKSEKILHSLGMELITIRTNFRSLEQSWLDCHGAGLASCLMMFQGEYNHGLIASSSPYNALNLPWGSNPITDWMFSSSTFKIMHDGASFIRREKIREITEWPEAMKFLRVCWEGKNYDRNCGRCEKCVRTILSFRVMGYGLPECFEKDVDNSHILALTGLNGARLHYLEEILSVAKSESINESWVSALEICVKHNREKADGKQPFWKKVRKRLGFRRRLRWLISPE